MDILLVFWERLIPSGHLATVVDWTYTRKIESQHPAQRQELRYVYGRMTSLRSRQKRAFGILFTYFEKLDFLRKFNVKSHVTRRERKAHTGL